MAWNGATQAKYGRSDDYRQNDLSDEEWALIEASDSGAGSDGPSPHDGPPPGVRCDPVHAGIGMPVAPDSV